MISFLQPYMPAVDYYEVIINNQVVFWHSSYAMCNGYICRNAIMGVRPKPVRINETFCTDI